MKDDISTPTPEGGSPNQFERDKPQTNARGAAEAAIEELRQRGGVFVDAVRATRMPMAMTDPTLPGNPIVFANKAFLRLTGYRMEEVLGQQPHFMNGPDTDPKDAARFTEAVRADQDDIIETVQYRKNGSRFVATVLISGFKDDEGRTVNRFMSWLDVTRRVDAEDEVTALREAEILTKVREDERERELRTMTKLHDLGDQLLGTIDLNSGLGRVLDAALEVAGSNRGTLQILDPEEDVLRYAATRSFDEKMLAEVPPIDRDFHSTCAVCIRTGERVVAGDIASDPTWADHACTAAALGYGAAFSVPMKTRRNELLGVITIHFEKPYTPSETELRWTDLFARMGAHLVERARAEEALRDSERHANMLLAELQHRVRNTLAVVRSMARRTAENSRGADEMLAHFQGRLDAFSRVQAALTRNPDARIDLKSLIEDELVAHAARDGEQVEIKGPPVLLDAKSAERLSLAIHELTTNAVKHGALTNQRGRIDVSWDTERAGGGEQLNMRWIERDVAIEPSRSRGEGFGMELLLRSLPYDLDGETEVELTPSGLRFELRMPLSAESA